MRLASDKPKDIAVIYDGDCPFCAQYVRMLRLKKSAGEVHLLDARDGGHYVEAAKKEGMDLNDGMAALYGGRWYHGADCMHLLATLTSRFGFMNSAVARIFESPGRARVLYPALKAGRNIVLRLLGRKPIGQGRL